MTAFKLYSHDSIPSFLVGAEGCRPVLEFRRFLQELQAGMGQQDARHHGFKILRADVLAVLFPENVKHAPHRVHLQYAAGASELCTR